MKLNRQTHSQKQQFQNVNKLYHIIISHVDDRLNAFGEIKQNHHKYMKRLNGMESVVSSCKNYIERKRHGGPKKEKISKNLYVTSNR